MRYFIILFLAFSLLGCSNELIEEALDWAKFETELTRSGCNWAVRCEISMHERVYICTTETHVIYYHVTYGTHPEQISPLHADYLCFGQNQ